MKPYLIFLLIVAIAGPIKGLEEIKKENELKAQAQQAWEAGEFKAAADYYAKLNERLPDDEPIAMNLAHALYRSGNSEEAMLHYGTLTRSSDVKTKSAALQQLGVIQTQKKAYKEALSSFKAALKADPLNDEVRYNYELTKKLLEQQEQNPDQQQDEQNQDQENQENQQQQQQDQKGEQDEQSKEEAEQEQQGENNKEPSEPEEGEQQQEKQQETKPQQAKPTSAEEVTSKIEKERAEMILKAMERQEKQYYQQRKRQAKNKKSTGKPDW